jgi:aminopeptidase N/puromycin-sensitive aminopeptidase
MCHHPSRFLLKALAITLFSCVFPLFGQRLPQNVQPEHYTLALIPDLKSATFSGKESITIRSLQAANEITLNAIEIKFQRVSASVNGKDYPATVSLDPAKQQATFHFSQTFPAGEETLHVEFTGLLNNELRGFYLSKTKRRNYAVTQFEATDARRAFPCFDEPAFKATFSVSLTVDKRDTAISNMKIASDTPVGTGKHTLQFNTTPKMSTYLLAFLVGDFKCVAGSSDNTPIRVCAVPGDEQYGKFALSAAEYVLHYYNNYFGIKYPLPKLDMIAIPDFEAGAMENFGAITYRETDLLIDENTASLAAKKRVASVVAHEMAHQWFGDLVTMEWWDNIWLNEGFATWMENKPVEAWKPEWHVSQDVAGDLDTTLNYDSQPTTRTIRANASTPAQINEMFDGIAYGKAGAVLGMLENYLGQETFRRGVHNYLAVHLYSNATAEDFWNAQTKTSGKPMDRIMSSFVEQPGVPLLTFDAPQNQSVKVRESRFFITGSKEINASQKWMIPVCFHAREGKQCEVLNSLSETLKAPRASLFYGNAAAKGYYRSSYPEAIYQQIVQGLETSLTPEERIVATGNEWALMMAGQRGIGNYMSVVEALKLDKNPEVLRTATEMPSGAGRAVGKLQMVADDVTSDQDRKQFQAWVVQTFHPLFLRLRKAEHGGSDDDRERLASLFTVLGLVGKDPSVIADAQAFTQRYLKGPSSVDPILATTAPTVAVATGDAALYEQVLKLHRSATDPTVSTKALYLLAEFHNPELAKRTLDYAVSGQVRNQDAVFLLSDLLRQSSTRKLTWQYFHDHWPQVAAQLTPLNGNRIVTAAGGFCAAGDGEKVNAFFTSHKVASADRALRQAVEKIGECTKLHDQQGPKLSQWLAAHRNSGAASQSSAGE